MSVATTLPRISTTDPPQEYFEVTDGGLQDAVSRVIGDTQDAIPNETIEINIESDKFAELEHELTRGFKVSKKERKAIDQDLFPDRDLLINKWNEKHGAALQHLEDGKKIYRHTWPNGDKYEGEFHHGVMHGFGSYWYAGSLNWYSGQWVDGKKSGLGTFFNHYKNEEYIGNWENGCRSGYGTSASRDTGTVHHGLYHKGKPHGHGVLINIEGRYEGMFVYGHQSGEGIMKFSDGSVYDGMWMNGKFHGTGVLQTNGIVYKGEWVQNYMHGKGTCTYWEGSIYNGTFVQGMRHGDGEEYMRDGSVFVGTWENNKRHGKATLVLPNGERCIGVWEDGRLNGPGVFQYMDGRSTDIVFNNGQVLPPALPQIKNLKEYMKKAKECQQIEVEIPMATPAVIVPLLEHPHTATVRASGRLDPNTSLATYISRESSNPSMKHSRSDSNPMAIPGSSGLPYPTVGSPKVPNSSFNGETGQTNRSVTTHRKSKKKKDKEAI